MRPPRSASRPAGGWPLRILVLAGLCALALGGGIAAGIAAAALAGVLLPAPRLDARVWPALHGLIFALTCATAAVGAPVPAFAVLTAWLLVHQAWTGRTAGSVRISTVLATLLLLLGSTQTESPLLGPLFLAYIAVLPLALLRAQLHDVEVEPSATLEASVAVACLALATVLFFGLPRLQGGYLGAGGRNAFPEGVTLGEDSLVDDDLAIVMRLRVTDEGGSTVRPPLYVRGLALDRFDGSRWTSTLTGGRPPDRAWDRRAEIELESLAGTVLFGVGELVRVQGATGVYRDGNDAIFHSSPGRALRYVAFGRDVPWGPLDVGAGADWLELPDLDPRVFALADAIAPDETDPARIARAMVAHLGRSYAYVEDPPAPGPDPLAWFLFDQRSGHCEYFSTALAVMLRVRGIPARVATGFYTEEVGEDGRAVVRRGHGHAWVEVPTAGGGWAILDATPASSLPAPESQGALDKLKSLGSRWYKDVVEYDMHAQVAAYGVVGRRLLPGGEGAESPLESGMVGLATVLGGMALLAAFARWAAGRIWGGTRRAVRDPLVRALADARQAVRSRGWPLPADLPPQEAAAWLAEQVGGEAAAPLSRLAELVYRVRYGGERVLGAEEDARACVRELRALPRPGDRSLAGLGADGAAGGAKAG